MLNAVLNNLINIGWAMLIFLCAYLSNVAFSLYYNIKVLLQPFDRQKMINSGLKVATFVVGLTLGGQSRKNTQKFLLIWLLWALC